MSYNVNFVHLKDQGSLMMSFLNKTSAFVVVWGKGKTSFLSLWVNNISLFVIKHIAGRIII